MGRQNRGSGMRELPLTPIDSGASPLIAAVFRECLHLTEDRPSHVLFVSLDSIGAETGTPAAQLGKTSTLEFIGGLQCSYLLYDVASEAVVAAGVERKLRQLTHDLKSGKQLTKASFELD